ncbi:uncharacterized protein LOC108254107, partial [Diaphorina citri]|uniref:Uncharacterized protein LOC108254107 n=1 Tax=Diaphorina citri TaxID=121845 RepID=A0A1S4EQW9_DIACI
MGIVTKFFCTILCVAAQYWYISIPGALLVLLKMYNQMSMGIYKKDTMMNGKTVIITGANSAQYWYISIPGALLVLLKMYNQMSMGIYKKDTMMNGKTVIITGANS